MENSYHAAILVPGLVVNVSRRRLTAILRLPTKHVKRSAEDPSVRAIICVRSHATMERTVDHAVPPAKSDVNIHNVHCFVTKLVLHVLRNVLGLANIKGLALCLVLPPATDYHVKSDAPRCSAAVIDVQVSVVRRVLRSTVTIVPQSKTAEST